MKCLNHGFECPIGPCEKLLCNYLKRVLHLKFYVSFLVLNPCIHDIYYKLIVLHH